MWVQCVHSTRYLSLVRNHRWRTNVEGEEATVYRTPTRVIVRRATGSNKATLCAEAGFQVQCGCVPNLRPPGAQFNSTGIILSWALSRCTGVTDV